MTSPRSIRIPKGPPPPPIPGATVGAETRRRVLFRSPPRRGELSTYLRGAWAEWQRVDPERAGAAVLVFCQRRFFRGGCIFESRTFGAPIIARFHDTGHARRIVSGFAAGARRRERAKIKEAALAQAAREIVQEQNSGNQDGGYPGNP